MTLANRMRRLKRPKWLREAADHLDDLQRRLDQREAALRQAVADLARIDALYQQMERKNMKIIAVCQEPIAVPHPVNFGSPKRLEAYLE